jgi:predicted 3-demethylubiquinone-9 3-methyltransferase (glyoxalase superfamily)
MGAAIVADGTPDAGTDEFAPHLPSESVFDPFNRGDEMARPKLYPCLWFDGNAEEAATFYASLLPDSRVDRAWRSPAGTPSGPEGMVLTVDFTVAGQQFQGLNGGPDFNFNEAVSFVIECEDQAEVDRLWDALIADGGEPGPCGWLKDRFGVSWQVVPKALNEMVEDPDTDAARRAMEAMLQMGKLDVEELRRAFEGEPASARA